MESPSFLHPASVAVVVEHGLHAAPLQRHDIIIQHRHDHSFNRMDCISHHHGIGALAFPNLHPRAALRAAPFVDNMPAK
uniref:Uncharacterized protein n=1 Tax=Ascaris lumbricoides TaxID=6252 RepID=A0A0M3HYU3_ASCLU